MLSSEFDLYFSTFYSQHGSLLYTAALKGDPRIVKTVFLHSWEVLDAVHARSRETALEGAVRMCNLEAVIVLTAAGADILHPGPSGIPLLHRTIKGGPTW